MRRAVADRLISLPRGWVLVGLALAAWCLFVLVIQLASSLFNYIAAAV
jgi:hypothetical protein